MNEKLAGWALVSKEVNKRMAELDLPQIEVARRALVSASTLREIQWHRVERTRNHSTLVALSRALEWPPDYIVNILRGDHGRPTSHQPAATCDAVQQSVDDVAERIERLTARIAALEATLLHDAHT